MFIFVKQQKKKLLYAATTKLIVFVLSFSLVLGPSAAQAQSVLNLPIPGTMITPSPAFVPVLLKGMTVHPDDPLKFDFIIDSGNTDFTPDEIKKETEKLVKYFLASMTVPKDDLWVNLSPYEAQRIIPEELGKTELGRDMLTQDYILKQLTASLMYPEEELGKKFWDKIYKQAKEQFGTSEIPVNTFNKVWILPERATVYEHEQTVYIVDTYLKVMLDSDYQAMSHEVDSEDGRSKGEDRSSNLDLQSSIIKEIIIPAIEHEVNTGTHFAPLRQIYHSLILAKWYKETIKNSLLSQVYADKNLIAGIESGDETIKDQIYARYIEAYKKGVFNYIKEDYDQLSNEMIPRKYFSGGLGLNTNVPIDRIEKTSSPVIIPDGPQYTAEVAVFPESAAASPLTDWRRLQGQEAVFGEIGRLKSGLFDSILRRDGIETYPHTIRLIEEIKASSGRYRMNVASSSRSAKLQLEIAGVLPLLREDLIVDGHTKRELHFRPKPAGDMFVVAGERVDITPQGGVVIEDLPNGVAAGRDGKFVVLALDQGEQSIEGALTGAGAHEVKKSLEGFTLADLIAFHRRVRGPGVPFEGVVFDNDGVIVNSEPIHFRVYKQVIDDYLLFREGAFSETHEGINETEYYENIATRGVDQGLTNFFTARKITFAQASASPVAASDKPLNIGAIFEKELRRLSNRGIEKAALDRIRLGYATLTGEFRTPADVYREIERLYRQSSSAFSAVHGQRERMAFYQELGKILNTKSDLSRVDVENGELKSFGHHQERHREQRRRARAHEYIVHTMTTSPNFWLRLWAKEAFIQARKIDEPDRTQTLVGYLDSMGPKITEVYAEEARPILEEIDSALEFFEYYVGSDLDDLSEIERIAKVMVSTDNDVESNVFVRALARELFIDIADGVKGGEVSFVEYFESLDIGITDGYAYREAMAYLEEAASPVSDAPTYADIIINAMDEVEPIPDLRANINALNKILRDQGHNIKIRLRKRISGIQLREGISGIQGYTLDP